MRVLYIDVDSLRPDHLGAYGYGRALTPHLDRIARESAIFLRCYCSDSPCLPSRAALTTMSFGIRNGVIGHHVYDGHLHNGAGGFHAMSPPLLGRHLDQHGIKTASVSCFADRHRAYFFLGNFRETIRPSLSRGNDEDAGDVNRAAFRWLRDHAGEKDWFLHLNYWDPHTNYVMPPEWAARAAALGPAPAWPDGAAIAAHQSVYGPHSATDLHANGGRGSPVPATMPDQIRTRADFEKLINGYDGAIHYWDHHFGQLLDELARLGILDDTAIIVTADHGESFGENGSYAEHGLANEATHRIPLIVRWPGLTDRLTDEQRYCDALLYHLDLGPTLCELLGAPVPEGWDGASWASVLRGQPFAGRDQLFLGHGAHTYQRALRTAHYFYIRTLHPGCFSAEAEQLFHVSEDPFLTRDLFAVEPQRAGEMRAALAAWVTAHAPDGRDPMLGHLQRGPTLYAQPARYISWLRSAGRGEQADDLDARLRRHGIQVS